MKNIYALCPSISTLEMNPTEILPQVYITKGCMLKCSLQQCLAATVKGY